MLSRPGVKSPVAPVLLVLAALVGGCHTGGAPAPAASGSSTPPASTAPPPGLTAAPDAGWQVAGTSVQGRLLRVKTLGHGPRTVLFVGGIHGDEPEGSYTTSQLPAAFAAAVLADTVTLTILEDANPDGRAAHTRGNANGVDLNRNFPASNFDPKDPVAGRTPLSQNESRALAALITDTRPQLVMVLHSWQDRQFINFDGPVGPLAECFAAASGLPLTESQSFAPTPGSLGSWAGRDRHIPVLTVELRKGSDPQADWEQIRAAVMNAIAGRPCR